MTHKDALTDPFDEALAMLRAIASKDRLKRAHAPEEQKTLGAIEIVLLRFDETVAALDQAVDARRLAEECAAMVREDRTVIESSYHRVTVELGKECSESARLQELLNKSKLDKLDTAAEATAALEKARLRSKEFETDRDRLLKEHRARSAKTSELQAENERLQELANKATQALEDERNDFKTEHNAQLEQWRRRYYGASEAATKAEAYATELETKLALLGATNAMLRSNLDESTQIIEDASLKLAAFRQSVMTRETMANLDRLDADALKRRVALDDALASELHDRVKDAALRRMSQPFVILKHPDTSALEEELDGCRQKIGVLMSREAELSTAWDERLRRANESEAAAQSKLAAANASAFEIEKSLDGVIEERDDWKNHADEAALDLAQAQAQLAERTGEINEWIERCEQWQTAHGDYEERSNKLVEELRLMTESRDRFEEVLALAVSKGLEHKKEAAAATKAFDEMSDTLELMTKDRDDHALMLSKSMQALERERATPSQVDPEEPSPSVLKLANGEVIWNETAAVEKKHRIEVCRLYANKCEELDRLALKHDDKRHEVVDLMTNEAKLETTLADLREELSLRVREIEELKLAQAVGDVMTIEGLEKPEAEIERLKVKIATLKKEVVEWKEEAHYQRKRGDKFVGDRVKVEAELERWKGLEKTNKAEAERLDRTIEDLREELSAARFEVTEEQREVKAYIDRTDRRDRDFASLEEELSIVKNLTRPESDTLATLREELAVAREGRNQQAREVDRLRQRALKRHAAMKEERSAKEEALSSLDRAAPAQFETAIEAMPVRTVYDKIAIGILHDKIARWNLKGWRLASSIELEGSLLLFVERPIKV